MDNDPLHASIHYPADKIEERITFALCYACLHLTESDDERDAKFVAANKFDIFCGGGVSHY